VGTGTQTVTHTTADIRRVLDTFGADLLMVVQATSVSDWTRSRIDDTVHDLKVMAENGCIDAIHIVLYNSTGDKIRAAKYTVSTSAQGWTTQRPGNNLWPDTAPGSLHIIVSTTDSWAATQASLASQLTGTWTTTTEDTTHAALSRTSERRYASNGWGLERGVYG
jgi:Bacterial HORMA domain family 1